MDKSKEKGLETSQDSEPKEESQTPHRERLEREIPRDNGPRAIAIELGGFILAQKHMETLEGLLKVYEARLKNTKTIKQRWRRYLEFVREEESIAKEGEPKRPRNGPHVGKKTSMDKLSISKEPRKYPTSHVLEVEDAILNKLWEELK